VPYFWGTAVGGISKQVMMNGLKAQVLHLLLIDGISENCAMNG